MAVNLTSKLTSCLIAASLIVTGTAHADHSKLAADLEQQWKSNAVTLRVPDRSSHLKFNAIGERLGGAKPGVWATDAVVQVEAVEVRGRTLEITGKRIPLYFDHKQGRFERTWTPIEVRVSVELKDTETTSDQFMPVLKKIFLTGSQKVTDLAPPYWATCLKGAIVLDGRFWTCKSKSENRPDAAGIAQNTFRERVYKVAPGITPPKPVSTPDPGYPDIAKKLKVQGTVVLGLIVDTNGRPKDIQIVRPMGLGLDDEAVRAVEKWKFEPSMHNGSPVPVQIHVEVNFRLY